MKKALLKSFILLIIALMVFSSCSVQTESPEISPFPTLRTTESAKTSESPSTAAPGQATDTTGDFSPDENAPVKLSLSFIMGSRESSLKDSRVYKAAMEYMRRHPDVFIDLRSTPSLRLTDYEKYSDSLTDSLSAGTSADITLLDYFFPIRKVAAEATLVNFEELIESDREAERSDFFENILDAVKSEGGLYVMPLSFDVNPYMMNKEYTHLLDKPFEEYKSFDYRDMMSIYEKALARQTDGDMLYMDNNTPDSSSAFTYALDLQSLDNDTKTIDIYNEFKRDLVEKAVSLPVMSASDETKCRLSDFFFAPEINTLFADSSAGNGTYLDCFMGYEDIKYTSPVPLADFGGNVHFMLYQSAIISRNCQEIETAWDFLKFLMGYDRNYDGYNYHIGTFYQADPVLRDFFNEVNAATLEWRYAKNLEAGRTLPYPKEEAIKRAVSAVENMAQLAAKRSQTIDIDFLMIWNEHYSDYTGKTTTVSEMLKALERDLSDLMAKY